MRRTTITWERGAGFNRTTLSVNEASDPRARSLYVDQYDTFISHKGDDIDLAIRAGDTLYKCGLHGYLDVWDPKVDGDDPELEVHLRDVIRPSPSLLAVVSENTNLSWWVPFEIGVARETESVIASLLSVNENSPTTMLLPSYLRTWPILASFQELETWATDLAHSRHIVAGNRMMTESVRMSAGLGADREIDRLTRTGKVRFVS